jgi:hypothetical protein
MGAAVVVLGQQVALQQTLVVLVFRLALRAQVLGVPVVVVVVRFLALVGQPQMVVVLAETLA